MIHEIVNVASAMTRKMIQMDHTANNLANVSTPGYKAEHLRALQSLVDEKETPAETIVDFSRGSSEITGNMLDVRIEGNGFFVIQTKEGLAFTRKGDFTIDKDNRLITQDGAPVMGDGGTIQLREGTIHIGRDGSILVDADTVGKLRVVDFDNQKALTRTGDGLFRDPGTAGMKPPTRTEIASGNLERSNVNVFHEMVDMIEINRSFEYYQKIIQTLAEMDKMSVGRLGRLV